MEKIKKIEPGMTKQEILALLRHNAQVIRERRKLGFVSRKYTAEQEAGYC